MHSVYIHTIYIYICIGSLNIQNKIVVNTRVHKIYLYIRVCVLYGGKTRVFNIQRAVVPSLHSMEMRKNT